MGLETGDTINDLNENWPLGTDPKAQGDNHIRLIKSVMKNDALSLSAGGTIEGDVTFNGNVVGVPVVNPNLIINSGFDIWQRGDTFTGAGSGNYTADRWHIQAGASASKSSDTPTGFGSSINITTGVVIRGSIEINGSGDMYPFEPNTDYTISFYIKAPAGADITFYVSFMDNNSGAGNVPIIPTEVIDTGTGAWQKVEYTFNTGTVVPVASNTGLMFGIGSSITNFFVTKVKLEQGSVATPWVHEDIGTTLAKCQRYARLSDVSTRVAEYTYEMRVAPTQSALGGAFLYDAEL